MTSLDIFQESVDSMTDISPFAIAKGVVKVDKDLFNSKKIKDMIDFVTDAGNVVFQRTTEDNKRFVHVGIDGWGQFKESVDAIENQVKDLISHYGYFSKKNLLLFTPSLIVSKAGCVQQKFHFDYSQKDNDQISLKVKNSFFMVVAIMNGTSFQGCNYTTHQYLPRIKLNIGDILIGRGDFLHAGDSYNFDNIRMHFFVDFSNFVDPTLVQSTPKKKYKLKKSSDEIRSGDEVYDPIDLNINLFQKKDYLVRANNFGHAKAGHVIKKVKRRKLLSNFTKNK